MTKMKTGSSSSGSSDSSDSEDSDNGNCSSMFHVRIFNLILSEILLGNHCVSSAGLVPKPQKTQLTNKDTKGPLQQPLGSGMGPAASAPQPQPQLFQPKPPFAPPPPVPVSVPSLDSSQLMTPGFDPLPHFMNSHLTQPNTEASSAIPTASAPAAPDLSATRPIQMPPETHPFLNQHPIIASPGKSTVDLFILLEFNVLFCLNKASFKNLLVCFSLSNVSKVDFFFSPCMQQFIMLFPSNHPDLATAPLHFHANLHSRLHPLYPPSLHHPHPSCSPHFPSTFPSPSPGHGSLHHHPMASWVLFRRSLPKLCSRTMRSQRPRTLKPPHSVKSTTSCSRFRLGPPHRRCPNTRPCRSPPRWCRP